jgi:hypothetical protein
MTQHNAVKIGAAVVLGDLVFAEIDDEITMLCAALLLNVFMSGIQKMKRSLNLG